MFESRGIYLLVSALAVALAANSFRGADTTKIVGGAVLASVAIAILSYKSWRVEQLARHDCKAAAFYCLDGEP